MPTLFAPAALVSRGLDEAAATALAARLNAVPASLPSPERWRRLSREVLSPPVPFAIHRLVFTETYADWDARQGPPPAWLPEPAELPRTNIGQLLTELGLADYPALHRWSVTNRELFWDRMIRRLGIRFVTPYERVQRNSGNRECPDWLPGARLNIVASCFQAPPDATAVVWRQPGQPLQRCTYGALDELSNRVANGLGAAGFRPGDALAVNMPMNLAAVAIYLGIIKAGAIVVSISDSFSAAELATRLKIAHAVGIFTQDLTGGREPLYPRAVTANAPRAIVVPAAGIAPGTPVQGTLRTGDLTWDQFLSPDIRFTCVPRAPGDFSNILFSSGTTADPKAIPWTHTTPIRAAADGCLHHDLQATDVVAWPTNLGWMMGPWLVYASLINRASIALFDGPPTGQAFGEFVRDAGVTVLGLVPSLVKSWRRTGCMEGLDWSRLRLFSSTGECSNAEDYHYLMMLAGYKPVIEYCGGTEIGGGYITGTVVQPASPATFSTPALGLDFVVLDEAGQPTTNGEVFLLPPSIGLSNELLNHDHHRVYYEGTPPGPNGELRRRHGDQMEALGGGYYRSHGRADDTMKLKGIKVSSAEIERLLNALPGLHETAAVGVPPPAGGPSQLVVFAVPLPGAPADKAKLKTAMQAALRAHYGAMFKIYDVVILEALPRTASNKVMRRLLRDRYQWPTRGADRD